jgi:hypothetical protein
MEGGHKMDENLPKRVKADEKWILTIYADSSVSVFLRFRTQDKLKLSRIFMWEEVFIYLKRIKNRSHNRNKTPLQNKVQIAEKKCPGHAQKPDVFSISVPACP